MVHLSFCEGVGLLGRTFIAISILRFRTFSGIMSSLLALETSNVAQIPLGWCCGVGMVLTAASSIPIAILGANVIVRTCSVVRVSSMVMSMSSRVRVSGKLIHEHLWDRRTEPLSVRRGAEIARRADRGEAHEQFTQLWSSPER